MRSAHSPKGFIVIGAGIVGLSSALELQRRGHKVVLYDQHVPKSASEYSNITAAAAGQFLPFVYSDSDKATEERIMAMAAKSREIYHELAKDPAHTGVIHIKNVELVNSANDWSPRLVEVMEAGRHKLKKPIILKARQPHKIFDVYYEFHTFSIRLSKLMFYLLSKFIQNGGEVIEKTVTGTMLHEFKGPVIQAAGINAPLLAGDYSTNLYKGYTVTYHPKTPIPAVAISADDLLVIPQEGGDFAIGPLYMHKPHSHKPEKAEYAELLRSIQELATLSAGSFTPLDKRLLDQPLIHRVGQRVTSQYGPIIQRDAEYSNILHNYAYGSVGCSTAFGGAVIAADILEA